MKRNMHNHKLTWTLSQGWVPFLNILRKVPVPAVIGLSDIIHKLDKDIIDDCVARFALFNSKNSDCVVMVNCLVGRVSYNCNIWWNLFLSFPAWIVSH